MERKRDRLLNGRSAEASNAEGMYGIAVCFCFYIASARKKRTKDARLGMCKNSRREFCRPGVLTFAILWFIADRGCGKRGEESYCWKIE